MPEPGNLQVVLMGLITVFAVLISLIVITHLLGYVVRRFQNQEQSVPKVEPATPAPSPVAVSQPTPDKQKLVAAISVAIAEDMGTDVSHIRIHSISKI